MLQFMNGPQINQMELNALRFFNLKVIKFCYLLIPIIVFGCTDKVSDTNKKATEDDTPISLETTDESKQTILCFGDSITAGFGLEDTNDAYPALLQAKIDAIGLNYTVVNSGLSGETTAGGLNRISWVLGQDVSVFLLELGANDGLRGVPMSETRANLQAIINTVKTKRPKATIILAGMQLPPNMGQDYTTAFKLVFEELARENNLEFIPFILKDVGGIAELNQADGIHPNIKGHKIVAENVWEILEPLIKS